MPGCLVAFALASNGAANGHWSVRPVSVAQRGGVMTLNALPDLHCQGAGWRGCPRIGDG